MQVNLCINTCRSDDGWHQMYLKERRDKVLAECVSLSCHSQVDMKVEREKLSDQLIQMFSKESTCKYFGDRFPFVEFKGERAVDMDGVTRELFSLFGYQIRLRYFESNTEMIPRVDPQTCGSDDHIYLSMGRILSYGFVLTGFFPIFLAKVSILSALCDNANISDETLLSSFLNYIDDFEHDAVKKMQSDDGSEGRCDVKPFPVLCPSTPWHHHRSCVVVRPQCTPLQASTCIKMHSAWHEGNACLHLGAGSKWVHSQPLHWSNPSGHKGMAVYCTSPGLDATTRSDARLPEETAV